MNGEASQWWDLIKQNKDQLEVLIPALALLGGFVYAVVRAVIWTVGKCHRSESGVIPKNESGPGVSEAPYVANRTELPAGDLGGKRRRLIEDEGEDGTTIDQVATLREQCDFTHTYFDDKDYMDSDLDENYEIVSLKHGEDKKPTEWSASEGAVLRKGPKQGGGGDDLLLRRDEISGCYSVESDVEPLETTKDAGSWHGIIGGYRENSCEKRFYVFMMEGKDDGSLWMRYYNGKEFIDSFPDPIIAPSKIVEVKHQLRLEFDNKTVAPFFDGELIQAFVVDLVEPLGATRAGFIASSGVTKFHSLKVNL